MDKKQVEVLIAMCGLVGASIGITIDITGVFYLPVAQTLHVGRGAVSFTTTVMALAGSAASMFVPKILNKIRLRKMVAIAALLMCGGALAMAFCRNLVLMYVISILRGIGCGLTNFVTATIVLNQWFYTHHGTVTAIALSFSGVPGVIFSNLVSHIIENSGWQAGYIAVMALVALFCLPSLIFRISEKPEEVGEKALGWEKEEQDEKALQDSGLGMQDSFSYLSPTFLFCLLFMVFLYISTGFTQHFPGYAVSIGKSAALGASMLSSVMAANILSKMLFGPLSDKIGNLKASYVLAASSVAGVALVLCCRSNVLLCLGSGLYAFSFPVSAIAATLAATDLFGKENYGRTYPVMNMIAGIFNALASSFYGLQYDMTGTYSSGLVLAAVLTILGVVSLSVAYAFHRQSLRKAL